MKNICLSTENVVLLQSEAFFRKQQTNLYLNLAIMATLKIKVPIYISSVLEESFYSYPEMCQRIEQVITDYNNRLPDSKLSFTQRTKLKQKVIKFIHFDRYNFGHTPALLLRIEEYKQNNKDLYLENSITAEQRDIALEDKIGSNYNYVLLYPLIRYLDNGNVENRWVAFVYNDPSKEDVDIKTTTHSVLSKILNLSVKAVMRESTRNRLHRTPVIPKVVANYVTVNNRPNDQVDLRQYELSCKSTRKITYQNLPQDELMYLMNDQPEDVVSKKITVQFNKNENVKMTYELNTENILIQTLIEESNGYEITLEPEDIATMHEPINVQQHLGDIITRFLSNEVALQND